LPVCVDEAHERDGRAADVGSERDRVVELALRHRVEHAVAPERREPFDLSLRMKGGSHHGASVGREPA
jgi:hypothetical protein